MVFQIHRHRDIHANTRIWTSDTGYFSDNDKTHVDARFMGPGGSVMRRDPETKTTPTHGLGTGVCAGVCVCVRAGQQRRPRGHKDTHMWPPDPDTKRHSLEHMGVT